MVVFISKKKLCCVLICYSCIASAIIPSVNVYRVEKRNYAIEPQANQFTISAYDKSYLVAPTISIYTRLNTSNPKDVFTIPPYNNTEFLPPISKWMIVTAINAKPTYTNLYLSKKIDRKQPAKNQLPASVKKDMVTHVPAHWISLTNSRGQYIIEPINYLFIVYAENKEQAIELLNVVTGKSGFPGTGSKTHGAGYSAYIGNKILGQLHNKVGQAITYANDKFHVQNDHFRVFGVYPLKIKQQQAFMFAASVSEESGVEYALAKLPPDKIMPAFNAIKDSNIHGVYHTNYGHHFVSFANARNNLAVALIQHGYPTYYSILGNMVNTVGESTEDHDGNVFITVIYSR